MSNKILFSVVFFALFSLPSFAAIKELSKTQKAYLKFPEYRYVKLSDSGKLAVVATTFKNRTQIAVLDRKNKKVLSAAGLGKDFNVERFIWMGDKKVILVATKSKGYLAGNRADQYVFTHEVGSKRLRKIFPNYGGSALAGSISFFSVYSRRVTKEGYLLVSEVKGSSSGLQTQLKKLYVNRGKLMNYDKVDMEYGSYAVDGKERGRMAFTVNDDNDLEIYTKNLKTNDWSKNSFWKNKTRSFNPVGFKKDETKLYFLADDKKSMRCLFSADIGKEGKVSNIKIEFKAPEGDVHGVAWDYTTREPLFATYGHGKPKRKYFSQSKHSQILQALSKSFPGEVLNLSEKTGEDYLVGVRSDFRPGTYYIFNEKKKEIREFLSANESLRGVPTSKAESFEFKARDGLKITGFLYKPKNWNKNTPMVMNIHGGPYGVRDVWRFDGDLQLLVSEGYSVMQVNYRGSGGRGKKFEKAGYQKQGKEMQYDLADAKLWAVKKGIVKKGNACIWGVSYGGYAAMMSTHMFPELFKCGIGFGGVYDWRTIHLNDSYGSDRIKKRLAEILPPSKKEKFNQSPIALTKDLKRPVLIMHGKEDVRVPLDQATTLKKELDKYKKPYKYREFDDIGHWFVADQTKKNQAYVEILNFLDEHLGSNVK